MSANLKPTDNKTNLESKSWIYNTLWNIGNTSGCHQIPERSFFLKGRQFPVCARCTGAFIGYVLGGIMYPFFIAPLWLDLSFCFLLFFDWLIQRLGLLQSTNVRRLATGIICGFALMQMYIRLFALFFNSIFFTAT